jgi:hypothetical protein
VPIAGDVGRLLRAEVLWNEGGEIAGVVYDVTPPVVAAPPLCERLELRGSGIEGEPLEVVAVYGGGVEGPSTIEWTRVYPDGARRPIRPPGTGVGVRRYTPTVDDVGCRVEVVSVPLRPDLVAGTPISRMSKIVTPALPSVMCMWSPRRSLAPRSPVREVWATCWVGWGGMERRCW